MGLFDKLLKGADKVYDAKTDLETEVFRDRRFERAEKLAATGDPNTAVITGIKRRYNDSLTDTDLRLEWFAPEPRVGAIHYGADIPLAIRLGSTIAVKTDGDAVVVDPAAMAGVPGAPSRRGTAEPEGARARCGRQGSGCAGARSARQVDAAGRDRRGVRAAHRAGHAVGELGHHRRLCRRHPGSREAGLRASLRPVVRRRPAPSYRSSPTPRTPPAPR